MLQTPRTKGKYIIGVMSKEEVEKSVYGEKIVFMESSISHKSMSGMVILFVTQQHKLDGDHEWNESDIYELRQSKPSTVGNKSHPHFGASGEYYSFCISAVYKIDNGSSVGNYANKRHKGEDKARMIDTYAKRLENKLICSMSTALKNCQLSVTIYTTG